MSASQPEAERVLRRLEWTVIRRLDGLLQGDYRTLFRGFGLDLADLREYQASDDVRHMDWNVTARTNVPHVRVYNEDREVTAWFLLDLSPSVDFGATHVTKRQLSIEFAALIARLLTRQGNKVGAVLYDGMHSRFLPPRTGRRHVLHLLQTIQSFPRLLRSPQTDVGLFVEGALAVIKRRAIVFVVSDFISSPGWERALSALNRRHEAIAVRLVDPMESRLPDLGLMVFEDAESGEQLFVDTNDRGFRERFTQIAARAEEQLMAAFGAAGMDALELSTGDDLFDAVRRFVDLRKMQANLGGGTLPAHMRPAGAMTQP